MADNFYPMGGTPDFYGSMLNSARQQLVRMPDGTYRVAPQASGPTTLEQIYGGIYAPGGQSGSAALSSHPVKLVAVDANTGNPVPTGGTARLSPNSGVLKTVGKAGNVGLPLGVVPASVTRMMADMSASGSPPSPPAILTGYAKVSAPRSASGTVATGKGQDRMPPTPLLAFGDTPSVPKSPAVAAIDAATVPLPRPRPVPTVPVPGITGPQPLTKFLAPNQRQNDTLTTAGNVAGNLVAGTPVGHVYSLLTGAPNTGGGILNGLFGYGGLFNGHPASAPPPLPSAAPVIPNSAYIDQWLNDTYGSARTGESGKGAWAV